MQLHIMIFCETSHLRVLLRMLRRWKHHHKGVRLLILGSQAPEAPIDMQEYAASLLGEL